jgi:hypothetical protein
MRWVRTDITCHYGVPTGTPHPGLPPEGGAPGQDGSTTASSRPQPLPLRELRYRGARGPAPVQRSLGKADQVAGAKPRGRLDASSQSGELPGAVVPFHLSDGSVVGPRVYSGPSISMAPPLPKAIPAP